ncbi:DUF6233 domain-containing protein [Streptomyces tauricus]|nr:DUF6233 domain-containing protein [Streptomyces tauricus]
MHRGDCWDSGKRAAPVTADQARDALVQGVRACLHCRPDTALGLLD